MVSAVLCRVASCLTNPNNFVTVGYAASFAYLIINGCKADNNNLLDKGSMHKPFGSAHIISIISQTNLSLLALIMSKNVVAQKLSTSISDKLGGRFLPSSRTLILAPLLLKTLDLVLHTAQNFISFKMKNDIRAWHKKMCQANFLMCTAYLTAFALAALTQFGSWKQAIATGILVASSTHTFIRPINNFLDKSSSPIPKWGTFLITSGIPVIISMVARQFFTSLSSTPKAMALWSIIVYNSLSVKTKEEDLL